MLPQIRRRTDCFGFLCSFCLNVLWSSPCGKQNDMDRRVFMLQLPCAHDYLDRHEALLCSIARAISRLNRERSTFHRIWTLACPGSDANPNLSHLPRFLGSQLFLFFRHGKGARNTVQENKMTGDSRVVAAAGNLIEMLSLVSVYLKRSDTANRGSSRGSHRRLHGFCRHSALQGPRQCTCTPGRGSSSAGPGRLNGYNWQR